MITTRVGAGHDGNSFFGGFIARCVSLLFKYESSGVQELPVQACHPVLRCIFDEETIPHVLKSTEVLFCLCVPAQY